MLRGADSQASTTSLFLERTLFHTVVQLDVPQLQQQSALLVHHPQLAKLHCTARIRLPLRLSSASMRLPSQSQKRTWASVALSLTNLTPWAEVFKQDWNLQLGLVRDLPNGGRLLGCHLRRRRLPVCHDRCSLLSRLKADVDPVPAVSLKAEGLHDRRAGSVERHTGLPLSGKNLPPRTLVCTSPRVSSITRCGPRFFLMPSKKDHVGQCDSSQAPCKALWRGVSGAAVFLGMRSLPPSARLLRGGLRCGDVVGFPA